MWGSSRVQQQRVLLLAVAFVLIQTYVLYTSTFHVFHNMMPMCPACVAIKSYQGSIVDNSTTVLAELRFYIQEFYLPPQLSIIAAIFFQPRAPPAVYQTI